LVSEHTEKLFRDADPLTEFWEWYELEYEGSLERGVQASELQRAYLGWCESQKIRQIKRGKSFAAACRARHLVQKRTSYGVIWEKPCRNVGKEDVSGNSPEKNSHGDFPEKPTFLHSYTTTSNEDEIVEEGLFEVQGEEL
jgi:hypothetical protein